MRHPHALAVAPILWILSGSAMGQSDAELEAPVFEGPVYFEMETAPKTQLKFLPSESAVAVAGGSYDWTQSTVMADSLVLVKGNTIGMNFRLINPLRYKIEVAGQLIEDNSGSIDELIKELTSIATLLAGGTSPFPVTLATALENETTSGLVDRAAVRGARAGGAPVPSAIEKKIADLKDPLLRQQLLIVAVSDHIDCLAGLDAPLTTASAIAEQTNEDVLPQMKDILKKLVELDLSLNNGQTKLDDINGLITALETSNADLATTLKKHTVAAPAYSACATAQNALIKEAFDDFDSRSQKITEKRKETTTKLRALHTEMTTHRAAVFGSPANPSGTLPVYPSTAIPKKKAAKIKVNISERTYSITSDEVKVETKDLLERSILVKRYRFFTPQIMPAVVYTNLTYSTFSVAEDSAGTKTVANATEEAGNVKVAVMCDFNMNFKASRESSAPMWQFGATVNKQRVLAFLGVGWRFNDNFALSLGLVSSSRAELDDLSVGDEVEDQAEIDDDLTYRSWEQPQLYFGIQLRP